MADHPADAGAHEPAAPFLCPVRGQIVTYVPSQPGDGPVLQRGTATGGVLTDPATGARWVPVIRPDLRLDLVDVERVVVFDPAARPQRPLRDTEEGEP